LEELRDAKLSVCITKFQAFCRGRMARQYQTRFSRQTDAIRIMQRNARLYVSLREWPWWKIYAKLKPLNAAYRVDSQMREKEQKISALETQLKDQCDAFNEVMGRNQELESEQSDFKEVIMAEQQLIRELEENQSDLRTKFTSAEERIEELELKLREKVETHKDELDQLVTQVDTSKLVNDRLSEELERSKLEISQLKEQLQQSKEELARLHDENASVIEKNKENEAKLHEQGTVQKDKIESLETENMSLKEKVSSQDTKLEQLRKALLESQENEKKLTEENNTLRSDISQVNSQLDSETKLKEDWESKYNNLKIDWDDLTALVRAEADQAKARMSR
jgi:myosin heavy subunit